MVEEQEEKPVYRLEIDENGMPVLNIFQPWWLPTLLTSADYYIRRLFKSRKEKEEEDNAISKFTAFLQRLRLLVEIDHFTGIPSFSIEVGDPPRFSGRRPNKHKYWHNRPRGLRKASRRKVHHRDSASNRQHTEEQPPIVVKRKHGTVIYNIYNLTVNVNAGIVGQLNTNNQQVINMISSKLSEKLEEFDDQIEP